MIFGLSIAQAISLVLTYGPEALSFFHTVEPLAKQIVLAAAPLAKKVAEQFGVSTEKAAEHGIKLLSLGAHKWTDDELQGWWDRAGSAST